jgi:hypothetical protein
VANYARKDQVGAFGSSGRITAVAKTARFDELGFAALNSGFVR